MVYLLVFFDGATVKRQTSIASSQDQITEMSILHEVLCQVEDLKVQEQRKCVFDQIVGKRHEY